MMLSKVNRAKIQWQTKLNRAKYNAEQFKQWKYNAEQSKVSKYTMRIQCWTN